GLAASRAGVSAGASRAGVGADVRASLRVAAAGELRRGPVRGAAFADPGHERAAPAGAHPPARALLAGRTGPAVRPVQADGLADVRCANAGVSGPAITQTVIGSPGVYDPRRNAMKLTGGLRGWDRPAALAGLREAFGPSLVMENDVDAAALAERALGHGREV